MKVLVVDDSSTMRRILVNCLAKMKITDVVQAGDGTEALPKRLRGVPRIENLTIRRHSSICCRS